MTRDRIRKGSVSLIAILLIVILMALPTGYEDAAIYKGTDRVRAKVLSTDESSVINNGLIQSGEQYCKVKILGGKFKGEETKAVNMLSGSLEADKIFQEGDIAQVVISYSNGEILSVMMSDHYRLDKELLLAGIFTSDRLCRKNRFAGSVFFYDYHSGNLEDPDTCLSERCKSDLVGNRADRISDISDHFSGLWI